MYAKHRLLIVANLWKSNRKHDTRKKANALQRNKVKDNTIAWSKEADTGARTHIHKNDKIKPKTKTNKERKRAGKYVLVHSENRRRGKNKTTGPRNRQNRDQLATAETGKLCLSLVSQRKYADCSSKTEATPSNFKREDKITRLWRISGKDRTGEREREREREANSKELGAREAKSWCVARRDRGLEPERPRSDRLLPVEELAYRITYSTNWKYYDACMHYIYH
jgi:hypothetical protein